ncbi:MAG: SAM-dependent methyltransferase [Actinoallomurus sp.]
MKSGSMPPGFDPTMPDEARVIDYMLGGKDNFAADREAADRALAMAPELPMMAREARKFLDRAVRFLVEAGIRQFVDIGCGLPTQGSVHEVAHATAPGARIVYVDNDPLVVNHAEALLTGSSRAAVVRGGARRRNVRTRAEVEPYFDGLDLVEPGIVQVPAWRPDAGEPAVDPRSFWAIAGVGRKP